MLYLIFFVVPAPCYGEHHSVQIDKEINRKHVSMCSKRYKSCERSARQGKTAVCNLKTESEPHFFLDFTLGRKRITDNGDFLQLARCIVRGEMESYMQKASLMEALICAY